MALLTIPASPEKGILQTYSLNVTDLIALISDPYFQNQSNWSRVIVMYQSSVSNQIESITFTPNGVSTSLNASAQFSPEARDIFNVQYISVFDKQNGRNVIYAASIPSVATYTIDMTPLPPNVLYLRDFITLNSQQSYETVSNSSGGPTMSFNPGGTVFATGYRAGAGFYNNDIVGAGLPLGTYKLRIYVTSYSPVDPSDLNPRDVSVSMMGASHIFSMAEAYAAIGSYLEVQLTGVSLAGELYAIGMTDYTLGSPRIEILEIF